MTSAPAAADGPALASDPQVAGALRVLDSWIDATVRSREQPGLSIGIVHGQDLLWAKGYGFADLARKVPGSPSTSYRIASISKLFTSTAILQLRDARARSSRRSRASLTRATSSATSSIRSR